MSKESKIVKTYRPRIFPDLSKRIKLVSLESGQCAEAIVNSLVEAGLPKLEAKHGIKVRANVPRA